MDSVLGYVAIAVVIAVVAVIAAVALVRRRPSTKSITASTTTLDRGPGVGDDDTVPRDTPRRVIEDVAPLGGIGVLEAPSAEPEPLEAVSIEDADLSVLEVEMPAPAVGRLHRLRSRLAKSNTTLGRGLLALLGSGHLDQAAWDEIEETLLLADLGVGPATELMDALRADVAALGTQADAATVREALRRRLVDLVDPSMDRELHTKQAGRPAVMLVVGVNGTGKTTTTGKIARLLVAEDRAVLLGAADTFRAAAADQLQTWGDRVGAAVVRGPEGGDPASVAFDAVRIGIESDVDTVVIDTAGRLHTKAGLMDELGKVKRVIEKQSPVDEVLLVIDATTGQNGLAQARVFAEVVDVTGIVLTKLDGTARGGIVVAVQRELGVPVKLVGLGEGPDDLAPFEPAEFVDALLSE